MPKTPTTSRASAGYPRRRSPRLDDATHPLEVEPPRSYTTDEVARLLGVSSSTVRRHLEPTRTPGGHRRYSETNLETLRSRMGVRES